MNCPICQGELGDELPAEFSCPHCGAELTLGPTEEAASELARATPDAVQDPPLEAPEQAAPAAPVAAPSGGVVPKTMLGCSLGLGVLFAVLAWIAYAATWLPAAVVRPILFIIAVVAAGLGTQTVNGEWLRWVTVHGVRWNAPVRGLARLLAIVLVPAGFLFFWGAMDPVVTSGNWLGSHMTRTMADNPELLKRILKEELRADERPAFDRFGYVSSEAQKRIEERLAKEFGGKFTLWAGVVVGGQVSVGLMLLWSALLCSNAAARAAAFHRNKVYETKHAHGGVVYFRSFAADAVPAAQEGIWASFKMQTEEELLAQVMPRGKPFFAIGRPKEPLPELGASRLYFETDEEWKAAALELMEHAAMVIIRPHRTPSLLWEMKQIVARVPPHRVAIWLPGSVAAEWEGFRAATDGVFPQGLPSKIVFSQDDFLVFGPSWEPHLLSGVGSAKPIKTENRRKRLKALVARLPI